MNRRSTRRKLLGIGGASAVTFAAGCFVFDGESADDRGDDDNARDEGHSHDEKDDHDPDLRINGQYLSSAFPVELVEPEFEDPSEFGGDARIVYVHWHGGDLSHWHQSPLELTAGETRVGRTRFLLEGPEELPIGPNEPFRQVIRPADGTPDELVEIEIDADRAEFTATDAGEGELVFELWADDERRWRSPPLPVEIA